MQSPQWSNSTLSSSPIYIMPPLRRPSGFLQFSMINLFYLGNIYPLKKYVAMFFLWQHHLLWYCCISLTRMQVLWPGCPIPTLLTNPTRNYLQMQQMFYSRLFNMHTPYLKSPEPTLLPLIHPASQSGLVYHHFMQASPCSPCWWFFITYNQSLQGVDVNPSVNGSAFFLIIRVHP